MKRTLGLLSVLALLGLGLFGASQSAASVLCEANESPCSSENVVESGMSLAFNAKVNFGTTITCTGVGSAKLTDTGGEGKSVAAKLEGLILHCTEKGAYCMPIPVFMANNANMDFSGSGGNGTVLLSKQGNFFVEANCGFQKCTFVAPSPIELAFTGGAPAVMAANVPVTSGESCPSTMSVELRNIPVSNLFLVGGAAPSPATRLCKANTNPCPKANRHTVGTALEGTLEGKSVFEFLYEGVPREPACEGGSLTGKTTVAGKPLIGEVSAMSFSTCGAGVCAVQAQVLPYKAEIEKTTGGNGTMALVSGGSGSPKIEVNCGKAFKCIFKATSVSFSVTGGSSPKIAVSQTLEKDAASEAECGSSMTWKATYKLTKPTPLFVTS